IPKETKSIDNLTDEEIAKIAEEMGINATGLTKEQITILKEYLAEKGIEYAERQRTFSFSVYIVFGYAFTWFTSFGNIILFVKRLMGF
ncbi:MAG: hypothetical protein N3B13_08850, partial [Deltaproteobacteria bacterium]|nr:hypothetical protein [Deltaproteobacteria bacterium]